MDLNESLVFVRVVQGGSFTAAARALGMPKSSVSKKVADLEERLGARLLQRTTRSLGLTDAGRTYFDRASRLVSELDEAERAVRDLQAAPRGKLRVSVPLSFGVLGPIVAGFLADNPDVTIDMECSDRIVDVVEDGFDVAIRIGALSDSSLVARKLGVIQRVLVASPKYLKRAPRIRTPSDLAKHACIAFGAGRTPSTWALQRGDDVESVRVAPRLVVNDFDMMLAAAREGLGVAWVLDFMAAPDVERGKLEVVLGAWCSTPSPVHAVYPSARHASPKVVRFIECLRDHFEARSRYSR